jgi:hypothetical protein
MQPRGPFDILGPRWALAIMQRTMTERPARRAYPAKLKAETWQIVIPTTTKTSPICLNSDFRSKAEAEAWMDSAQGRSLLALAQKAGRIPTP